MKLFSVFVLSLFFMMISCNVQAVIENDSKVSASCMKYLEPALKKANVDFSTLKTQTGFKAFIKANKSDKTVLMRVFQACSNDGKFIEAASGCGSCKEIAIIIGCPVWCSDRCCK